MLNRKMLTALLSLTLAGSLALPSLAASAPQPVLDSPAAVSAESALTRADLVSRLYVAAGRPAVDYTADYTDVAAEAQYAEAICWAAGQQLVQGYGDGSFGPDDPLTREQLAVILYRCAQEQGQGFTGAWAFLLPYSDAGEISSFSYEAVCWMSMHDIMGAAEGDAFAPGRAVTDGEADQVLARFSRAMDGTEIPNPFVTCATMDEAAQAAGFSLALPAGFSGGEGTVTIRAASGLIEVIRSGDGDQLTLRKGAGTEDISGDYGLYPETDTVIHNGRTITTRGSDGKIMTATWCDGGYAYAIRSAAGLDLPALLTITADMA